MRKLKEAFLAYFCQPLLRHCRINSGNVKRAAADALRVIATTQSLLLKVLSTDDKSTDGAKLGAELRAQSKRLTDEADSDDKRDIGFDIAPWTPQPQDYAWH